MDENTTATPPTETPPAHTVAEIRTKFEPLLAPLLPEYRDMFEELCARAALAERVTDAFTGFQSLLVTALDEARQKIGAKPIVTSKPSRKTQRRSAPPTEEPEAEETDGGEAKDLRMLVLKALRDARRELGMAQILAALGNTETRYSVYRVLCILKDEGAVQMRGEKKFAVYSVVKGVRIRD